MLQSQIRHFGITSVTKLLGDNFTPPAKIGTESNGEPRQCALEGKTTSDKGVLKGLRGLRGLRGGGGGRGGGQGGQRGQGGQGGQGGVKGGQGCSPKGITGPLNGSPNRLS